MDILLDLNIILDLLIPLRKGNSIAQELRAIVKTNGYTQWLSASSIDNLQYVLLAQAKKLNLRHRDKIQLELKKLLSEVKIFSVTGASIREALSAKDLEDHIIYTNFKRIAPQGIVITNDASFKNYPDVLTPEEFITRHKELAKSKLIPMLDLKAEYRYMLEDIDDAVLRTISDAKYILGPEVKKLEEELARYIGVKHCVGVSSGTDALLLSLRALAIKIKGREYFDRDDEIITTPFTFVATGDTILRSGATPVFVDIDPVTYNIDPKKIREYLQSSPTARRVIGIVPVHLYGHACDMDEIMAIANEYNLFVVEDVAQAFGGMWDGKRLGSIGTTGCFSFFPSKNLGAFGDAGAVVTNDDELAELIRMLRVHGGRDKYNVDHIGYKARLDTVQATILLAKLKHIDEFNERRRKIAKIYDQALAGINSIVLPVSYYPAESENKIYHVYHQYTIKVLDGKRDKLQKFLKDKGVDTMVYYPVPLHKMKVFDGRFKTFGELIEAERIAQEVLSLPFDLLQGNIIPHVSEHIKAFFEQKL